LGVEGQSDVLRTQIAPARRGLPHPPPVISP